MLINDIKTHYPGKSYSNDMLKKALFDDDNELSDIIYSLTKQNFKERVLLSDNFFSNLGVEYRNILCDPFDKQAWWDKNIGKDPFALEGAKAYEKLMANKPPLNKTDRLIIICNVSDSAAPNMGYSLLRHLQLRHENFVAPSTICLQGEGCSGFISGLNEADLYLQLNPDANVVILTVEMMATPLTNPWLQPALIKQAKMDKNHNPDSTIAYFLNGLGIQRYLFGDGCAAAYCASQGSGIEFTSFHKWSNLEPDDIHLLEVVGIGTKIQPLTPPFGFFSQQPKQLFDRLINTYLPEVRKQVDKIDGIPQNIAIHTGSKKILDLVKSEFNFSDEQIEPSRNVLKTQGNMNATTGAAILGDLLKNKQDKNVLAIFFGLGFALQLAY